MNQHTLKERMRFGNLPEIPISATKASTRGEQG